jgi:hypothetical protein
LGQTDIVALVAHPATGKEMSDLTLEERRFIEQGGALWSVRRTDENLWQVFIIEWEAEFPVGQPHLSQSAAEHWIFVLADIRDKEENMAVHHAIKRPDPYNSKDYPQLL